MVEAVQVMRSLHILFAVLWGGGSMYHGMIAMKGFMWKQPEARKQWWLHAKFGPFLGLVTLGTVVFGLIAYIMNGGPDGYTPMGNTVLSIGMLFGLIGAAVGYGGHLPVAFGLIKAHRADDAATVAKLEKREHVFDNISAISISIAILCMATFRLF